MAEADQVLAVVVAAREAAELQAGAAARAAPEVCGKPANRARHLAAAQAAAEPVAVERVQVALAVEVEMAGAVEAAQAVAVDLVAADRAAGRVVEEEASADWAEEQVEGGQAVEPVVARVAADSAEDPEVDPGADPGVEQAAEQAAGPALSLSQGDG